MRVTIFLTMRLKKIKPLCPTVENDLILRRPVHSKIFIIMRILGKEYVQYSLDTVQYVRVQTNLYVSHALPVNGSVRIADYSRTPAS